MVLNGNVFDYGLDDFFFGFQDTGLSRALPKTCEKLRGIGSAHKLLLGPTGNVTM